MNFSEFTDLTVLLPTQELAGFRSSVSSFTKACSIRSPRKQRCRATSRQRRRRVQRLIARKAVDAQQKPGLSRTYKQQRLHSFVKNSAGLVWPTMSTPLDLTRLS
jgi:hypothetical protein